MKYETLIKRFIQYGRREKDSEKLRKEIIDEINARPFDARTDPQCDENKLAQAMTLFRSHRVLIANTEALGGDVDVLFTEEEYAKLMITFLRKGWKIDV